MKQIFILVEGQTEEAFVITILAPYFIGKKINCTPVVVSTSKEKSGRKFKGGVINYSKVKNDIVRLLKNKNAVVTTMIDYYGLPDNFPGYEAAKKKNAYAKNAESIENAMYEDINNRNFLPYIQMHEFESLLFSAKSGFEEYLGFNQKKHLKFAAIFNQFKNPEEINDNPKTAPSKRILATFSEYEKTVDGILISEHITLPVMMKQCPHFRQWIEKILNLNKKNTK